ncbi:MAG: methylated-DNA--[protein]-cysteine S-methyltransferase [Bacteroidota bacterium]
MQSNSISEICVTSSPFGNWQLWASLNGLTKVKFIDKAESLSTATPHNPHLVEAVRQLQEYFAGTRQTFDLAYDWEGQSEFYQSVWIELLKIPFGKTTSYSQIAQDIDNPKAIRAVGMANARNPIALIVPCHRVIAKNKKLQGYAYGLDMKYRLLRHENPKLFPRQGSLF